MKNSCENGQVKMRAKKHQYFYNFIIYLNNKPLIIIILLLVAYDYVLASIYMNIKRVQWKL